MNPTFPNLPDLTNKGDLGAFGLGYAIGFAMDALLFSGGVEPTTVALVSAIGCLGLKNAVQAWTASAGGPTVRAEPEDKSSEAKTQVEPEEDESSAPRAQAGSEADYSSGSKVAMDTPERLRELSDKLDRVRNLGTEAERPGRRKQQFRLIVSGEGQYSHREHRERYETIRVLWETGLASDEEFRATLSTLLDDYQKRGKLLPPEAPAPQVTTEPQAREYLQTAAVYTEPVKDWLRSNAERRAASGIHEESAQELYAQKANDFYEEFGTNLAPDMLTKVENRSEVVAPQDPTAQES